MATGYDELILRGKKRLISCYMEDCDEEIVISIEFLKKLERSFKKIETAIEKAGIDPSIIAYTRLDGEKLYATILGREIDENFYDSISPYLKPKKNVIKNLITELKSLHRRAAKSGYWLHIGRVPDETTGTTGCIATLYGLEFSFTIIMSF